MLVYHVSKQYSLMHKHGAYEILKLILLSRISLSTSSNRHYQIALFTFVHLTGNICLTYFQAQNLQNGHFAAAKMCALQGEDDLSDFMIEIDILSECKHPNIVELHEAFFIDGKLWVRRISVSTASPYIPSVEQKSGS